MTVRWGCHFALLAGGSFAVPGAVGAQGGGTVETVLVVDAIGRIKLCVLQPRDEPLILVPELPSHQSGLSHHHHILQGTGRGANIIPTTRGCSVGGRGGFLHHIATAEGTEELHLHYSAHYKPKSAWELKPAVQYVKRLRSPYWTLNSSAMVGIPDPWVLHGFIPPRVSSVGCVSGAQNTQQTNKSTKNPQTCGPKGPGTAQHWIMSTCLYVGSVFLIWGITWIQALVHPPPGYPDSHSSKWTSKWDAYRYLAGERKTAGWTFLFTVAVVVAPSGTHRAAARHFSFPSLVGGLSCWLGWTKSKGRYARLVWDTAGRLTLRWKSPDSHLVGPPSAAISETDRFWDSLVGWDCTSCVWTLAPAWAPGLHKAVGEKKPVSNVFNSYQPFCRLMEMNLLGGSSA